MSPLQFTDGRARVFVVASDGRLGNDWVNYMNGVRPVINLKATTQFIGRGTADDPYEVAS